MTNGKTVCDYAVIRLLPYPDTEEFVNTGVVVACPEKSAFDFRIETGQPERIVRFFPQLDPRVLSEGLAMFEAELVRVRQRMASSRGANLSRADFMETFRDVVKPRESLFRFGAVGAYLARSLEDALEELFAHFVSGSVKR